MALGDERAAISLTRCVLQCAPTLMRRKALSCFRCGVLTYLLVTCGHPCTKWLELLTFCGTPSSLANGLQTVTACKPEGALACSAVGGPVAMAPPPAIPTATSEPSWTECFLESPKGDSGTQDSQVEVWLFRSDTSAGFEKFLKHRQFGEGGDAATCRSINPDSSIQCLECTRIIFGGVYGSIGVVVPAYPPEDHATGCLSRNRIVEADFEDDDNYDGNPTQEVALCNSHRGQLDAVSLVPP